MANKGMTITVPTSLYDFIDEMHWEARVKRSTLVSKIIQDWAVEQGYTPDDSE